MTHVLITGAHGFIARHLAPTLSAAGMAVTGTSRSATAPRGFERVHACRLGDSLADILRAERPDVVIHAALASGPDAYAANVEGTRRWLREASAAGVRLQVFLSSLSALPDAPSDYGRAKFDGEQDFVAADAVVLRMGVVIGPGGMFERLVSSSRRFPAIPLLDGGRQWVYVLGIDFLCAALTDCIAADHQELCGRTWNLQQPKPYTLRQIVESINRAYGFRRVLVPIPRGRS